MRKQLQYCKALFQGSIVFCNKVLDDMIIWFSDPLWRVVTVQNGGGSFWKFQSNFYFKPVSAFLLFLSRFWEGMVHTEWFIWTGKKKWLWFEKKKYHFQTVRYLMLQKLFFFFVLMKKFVHNINFKHCMSSQTIWPEPMWSWQKEYQKFNFKTKSGNKAIFTSRVWSPCNTKLTFPFLRASLVRIALKRATEPRQNQLQKMQEMMANGKYPCLMPDPGAKGTNWVLAGTRVGAIVTGW